MSPILPGAVLGVLGGGQLGRMFALTARRMGYRVGVLEPNADAPAAQVADFVEVAPYDDVAAVERFAQRVEVVTFEFENVPAATVEAAHKHAPVRPGGALLAAAQHRLQEKRALAGFGLAVPRFAEVRSANDIPRALEEVGTPAILKTVTLGYDGKGQARVNDVDEARAAFVRLGNRTLIAEQVIEFDQEISAIGARGLDGDIALYEPFANEHANHILDVTTSPARISESVRDQALAAARGVLEGFDVVGVVCVELFVGRDGRVLVNEIAPRPHNSGHITLDAHFCSQYEQQVRAICGLPLGDPSQTVPGAAMANLLGDLWAADGGQPDWVAALARPGVRLHLYGKSAPRAGRKMGHLTAVGATPEQAAEAVRAARAIVDRRR